MKIHGIASSYFGDQEWDVGKSVRWLQYFCDTEYVMDANLNFRPRAYLVAWAKTFRNVKYGYFSSHDFFDGIEAAASWRQTSFAKADTAWGYDEDDWVLFVDCTEGICIDESNPPVDLIDPDPSLDPSTDPFRSYVRQEIDNAGEGAEVIYLPFWAYTRSTAPFMVYGEVDPTIIGVADSLPPGGRYQGLTADELRRANITAQESQWDYYTNPGFLPRLVKVSALRDPGFDWATLDTFAEEVPEGAAESLLSLSLISYAYAQWASDPRTIDRATGLPESEAADDGFRMRVAISNVRPIDGLDTSQWPPEDTASEVAADLPEGLMPQSESRLNAEGPEFDSSFSSQMLNFQRREVEVPSDIWPLDRPQLSTPLYPTSFRSNVREGLFFYNDQLGPVPWSFLTGQPAVNPSDWDPSKFPQVYQAPHQTG
jgi:hypothetical protein